MDDLEVLHPEREVRIDGQTVTVREFGFLEGLRLRERIAPLLDDLGELLRNHGDAVGIDDLEAIVARHDALWVDLMARATGLDAGRIRSLGDRDGQMLLLAFWEVNSGFFVRRLVTRGLTVDRQPEHDPAPSTPH